MIYSAHFDASGNEDHHFITVAGGISSINRWIKFEKDWNKALIEDGLPDGTVFRMAQFAYCQGPFAIYKGDSARKAQLFSRLVSCIAKHVGKMFSVAVVVKDYKDFDREWCLHEVFGSPYSFASIMCVQDSFGWLSKSKTKRSKPLQIFFEKGDEHQGELDALCREQFSIEPTFRSKEMVQFQPGDLLAWKNRTAVTNALLKGPTGDPEDLDSIQRSLKELKRIHADNGVYDIESFKQLTSGNRIPRRGKARS
jgi:hypothetical protein